MNPHLGREPCRCHSRACPKEVAEVAATHTVFGGKRVDAERIGQACNNSRPDFFEQPLAFTGTIAGFVCLAFVGQKELEQCQFHVVSIAKVLLDGAAHKAQCTCSQG